MILEIVCIVFACVSINHMGLVSAVEKVFGKEIPIVNCVKCLTFWSVLLYTLISTGNAITSLAISFLASYCSLWVELAEAYIDTLYIYMYGKVTETDSDGASTSDPADDDAADAMPDLRQEKDRAEV